MPTPQEVEMFLASLGDDRLAQDLQAQIDSARALRNYQPAGSSVNARGITTPDYLGSISGMFVRGKGERQEKEARAQQAAIAEKQRKIAAEYFNKIFSNAQTSPSASTVYGPQPFKDGGVI